MYKFSKGLLRLVSLLGQYLALLGFWPHVCIWEAGRGERPELAVRVMKQDFVKIDRSVQ